MIGHGINAEPDFRRWIQTPPPLPPHQTRRVFAETLSSFYNFGWISPERMPDFMGEIGQGFHG